MTPEERIEHAMAEIRDEAIDPAVIENAAARVWERLHPHALRTCADFQALIPAYRNGTLPEARGLLLKDHTRDCVACRKVLAGEPPKVVAMRPATGWMSRPAFRWAMAACLALGVGLGAWTVYNRLATGVSVVQAVDGTLYRVTDAGAQPIIAGAQLPASAEVRTAKDSSAVVRLADGSLVEVRERSGFSVSHTRRDTTVNLGLGGIIVQAAKRRRGHLYVATRDCRVAVTGTVFSVNSGMKGSRVSVIEGQVLVAQDRRETPIAAGEQYVSDQTMDPVPVREEISWSRNLDAHLTLLRAVNAVDKRLQEIRFPELRYTSRILGMMPDNTVLYATMPNLGRPLLEAQQVFEQRIRENAELLKWWQTAKPHETIEKIRAASDFLGSEIVMAAATKANKTGDMDHPVFAAEVRKAGFREFMVAQKWPVTFVDNLNAAPPKSDTMLVWLGPDLVVISPDVAVLRQFTASATGRFAATPFGSRVAEAYRAGAGLLLAVDLERAITPPSGLHQQTMGLDSLRYLMVEQKDVAGQPQTRGVFAFRGQRTGVFSWIAPPAPMRALEFISPQASIASAAVVKTPAAVLDELFAMAAKASPDFRRELAELEAKLGLNVRADLAAPLGGDFAFAFDGPVLPTPSWKLAIEVYDATRLQYAIGKVVEAANRELAQHNNPALQFKQEAAGGRTWYSLVAPQAKPFAEMHWTYVDGYLVAAPNRALIIAAIGQRAAGMSLARSQPFLNAAPRDGYLNFSAVMWQNVGLTLGPLLERINPGVTPGQRQGIEALKAELKPTLLAVYGDPDRITVATSGSLVGLSLNMSLLHLLEGPKAERTQPRGAAYDKARL